MLLKKTIEEHDKIKRYLTSRYKRKTETTNRQRFPVSFLQVKLNTVIVDAERQRALSDNAFLEAQRYKVRQKIFSLSTDKSTYRYYSVII